MARTKKSASSSSKKSRGRGRGRSRSPSRSAETDLTGLSGIQLRVLPNKGEGQKPLWVALMTCERKKFVVDPATREVKMAEFSTCMPWPGKGKKSPTPAEIKRKLQAWGKKELSAKEQALLAKATVTVDPRRHLVTVDVTEKDVCDSGLVGTCTPRVPAKASRRAKKQAGRAFSRSRRGRQSKHLRTLENERPRRGGKKKKRARKAGSGFGDVSSDSDEEPSFGEVDLTGAWVEEPKPKPKPKPKAKAAGGFGGSSGPRTPPEMWD